MMSPSKILVVSLGLNLCALAAILFLVRSRPKPVETVRVLRLNTNSPIVQTGSQKPGTQRRPRIKIEALDWSVIEAEDYPTYIANLQAVGCPEETIKDIIIADVTKLYERRRAELADAGEKFKFWQTDDQRRNAPEPEKERQLRELEKERRALLRELLGENLELNAPAQLPSLAFLPEAKRAQVAGILGRYHDLEAELKIEGPKFLASEAGRAQLDELRRRERAELAQALTARELEDYDLRHSDLARQMRHDLVGFNPTEAEFRAMYRLLQESAGASSGAESTEAESAARRQDAKTKLEDGLKALLGEARYADLRRAKDSSFQELTEVARQKALPRQTAVTAYDMQHFAEQQALKLSGDQQLTDEQRTVALEAIRRETEKSLKAALGEKAYTAYYPEGVAWVSVAAEGMAAELPGGSVTLPLLPPLPGDLAEAKSRTNRTVTAGQVLKVYGLGTAGDGANVPRQYLIRRRVSTPTPESPP